MHFQLSNHLCSIEESYALICPFLTWKLCCVLSHLVMSDSATPCTVACQASLSLVILQARILEWVAMPSSRGIPNPGIKPRSSALQVDSLLSEPLGKLCQI